MEMDYRGPLDLTRRIEDLEKQKKILQDACRRAGKTIKAQKARLDALERGVNYESKKISSSLNTGITTEKLFIMLFIFINITIHMEWMKIN